MPSFGAMMVQSLMELLKNPNRTVCNVIETITVLNFRMFKAHCSSKEMLHKIK